uniref:Transcription initiation factor IIA gamma subunit C-terminal domain-containing protein n=1 Tax=Bos indicus x Bos taurus TaxID=30522 RepID=A0A4W2HXX1_BOBOX
NVGDLGLIPGSGRSLREGNDSLTCLNMYKFCNNMRPFVLYDVEFREVTELIKVDKVKIVACDGKNTGSRMTRKK